MANDFTTAMEQFLLQSANKRTDSEPFIMTVWIKGFQLKYPVNITCMKHIQKYYSTKRKYSETLVQNGGISSTIIALNQNENNSKLLCCGYIRNFFSTSTIPTDIINIINNKCIVPCIEQLRDTGVMILTNYINTNIKRSLFHFDIHTINIIIKSFKTTILFKLKSNIIQSLTKIAIQYPSYTQLIFDNKMVECIKEIRHLSAKEEIDINDLFQQISSSNMLPQLVELAKQSKYPQIQYEALYIILNITYGSTEIIQQVLNVFPLVSLIALLESSLYEIQSQILWTIGNIAGDCKKFRDELLSDTDFLSYMIQICCVQFETSFVTNFNNSETISKRPFVQFLDLLDQAAFTLKNVCETNLGDNITDVIKCLNILFEHALNIDDAYDNHIYRDKIMISVYICNMEVLCEICKTDVFDEETSYQIDCYHIIEQYLYLMDCSNVDMRFCLINITGNAMIGSDMIVKQCLNLGILNKYYIILTRVSNVTDKERSDICWALSNIMCGVLEDKEKVLNAKLFPILINLLKDLKYKTAKEALWAVSNALTQNTNDKILNELIHLDIFGAISIFLKAHTLDNTIEQILLETVQNVLEINENKAEINRFLLLIEQNGIWEYIKKLQIKHKHKNNDIQTKCDYLIQKYCS